MADDCKSCDAKNDVIVALQHVVRELQHELDNALVWRLALAEQTIREHGYTLRYVEYCEDATTPGLLGQIAGVTDHKRRDVKVARRDSINAHRLVEAVEHEVKHVLDPTWDCGNRDVFGRGGQQWTSLAS